MSEMALSRKKSRVERELITVFAVFAREITVFFKSPSMVVLSLGTPLIMMGMIGGNLMQNMTGSLGIEFGPFMLIGMIVTMLFMVTSVGLTSLVDDSDTDFNQEMLVSPVSRYSLVVGKIFGAMFGAIFSVIGTLIVGAVMGVMLSINQLLLIFALSPLICLSGGALSMIIIGLIKNKRTANSAVMIIVMPQLFLSGAIIPITNSSGILMVLSRLMPMTYCLDIARAVLYAGMSDYKDMIMFDPIINFAAIVGLTLACLIIGTCFYAQSEKNR
jgi:ABC-2 type transport system permease protein